jgi:AraC-like DNA-binding protein
VEYLLRYRIEKARGLLCSTGQSIKEVSRDCGFRSESYFSKVFRERVGTSPREYRRRLDGS